MSRKAKRTFINICFLQFPNKIYTPLWLPHHSLLRPLWFLKPDKVAHCLNFKGSDDLKESRLLLRPASASAAEEDDDSNKDDDVRPLAGCSKCLS